MGFFFVSNVLKLLHPFSLCSNLPSSVPFFPGLPRWYSIGKLYSSDVWVLELDGLDL